MEYKDLKNFGQLYMAKPSARVLMASFTSIPKELGFIGTPKFLAKLQSKERHWKRKRFKAAEERGLTHKEFIEGVRYSLAFYTAMIASCGKEKTLQVYPKLSQKIGVMMWEDFLSAAEDFLRFQDPWEAFREYFFEFYRTWERERVWRFKVVRDTATDFQIHVTDCAWPEMHSEGGCPEATASSSQAEVLYFPRLAQGIGGDFKQEDGCLCLGDAICDWHFYRQKVPD